MVEIGDTVYLAGTRHDNGKDTKVKATATVIQLDLEHQLANVEFVPGVTMVVPISACETSL